jgi:hypothetical protein
MLQDSHAAVGERPLAECREPNEALRLTIAPVER